VLARAKMFIRITRAPFLTGVVVPVLLGTAVAWHDDAFHLGYLLLTLLGAVCIHIGLDMSNDYFDHLSGNDEINKELTPFSGGSRVIQDGILSANRVLAGALAFYFAGIVIGLYLAWTRGWTVLWIGLAGVFLAFFHNAPPINLYRLAPGVGELAVCLGFGPVTVLGAYYVQAQRLSLEALWISIPIGLLIAAVLYVNEFPDHDADQAVGKKTLVVVLGRKRAVWGYVALLVAAFAFVLVGGITHLFPVATLLALVTLPLTYRAIRGIICFYADTTQLIPTCAATIQLHLLTGLLLCLGYVISGLAQS
jgi:1,4-dihydroxy-2-naphthoate octaprenyltransferase